MVYFLNFFQTWLTWQPFIVHSKTAVKDRVTELVFTLRARNSEFLFLVSREMTIVKNSYFTVKTMNLTETLNPFVCLAFNFQLTNLKSTDLEKKNVEKWVVLT